MVWYQRNYTMPYISKNVWCQVHYTQQHHQEERGGIFGGLFFVFSSHLQLKQPLKIPIKTSHTERQLFLCSQRWWENNVFTKQKIRAYPSFYRGKGWELRLASINCRAHPVSERCISVEQKGGKIGRFQHFQTRGSIRCYGKQRSAVAEESEIAPLCVSLLSSCVWLTSHSPKSFGSTLGTSKPLWTDNRDWRNRVAPGMWNCWE